MSRSSAYSSKPPRAGRSPGSLAGPIIIAIGLVVAAIAFAVVGSILRTADSEADLRLTRTEAAQTELEDGLRRLEARIDALEHALESARDEMRSLGPAVAPPPRVEVRPGDVAADHDQTEAPTEVMQIADARFNIGVSQPRNSTMLELLGRPREDLSDDCRGVTNPHLASLIETRNFGAFSVTMIRPALDSLERVMARLEETDPDLHDAIGTAGGLCVRHVRGSTSISNHSWGTAIDITLDQRLDGFGDGGTQFGLLLLAELFNEEGWYWGATYTREDSMHFEVGEETLRAWRGEGRI